MLLPTNPAEVEAWLNSLPPDKLAEVRALVEEDARRVIWRPQVGRQTEALNSEAFITGYGGAAGGGKTDLIAGLTLTRHTRSVVFRREKVQTEGIIQRLTEILGGTDGYNSQKSIWKVGDRMIEFGGLDNPNDHQKWQGRPHDLKAFDEVTEMREAQVRFIMGWTRTNDPGQRARVLMTFNPPTTTEGRWVIKFFAPWLDDKHPNPAKPGELRWFTTIGGKDVETRGPDPFVMFKGEPLHDFDPSDFGAEKIIRPKSRTFIPSRVTDNYFYVKTGYIDTLQSLPEPLRSQMLSGDFNAGVRDDEWQVIPTTWIDTAQARWEPRDAKGEMDSLGVDIAAGGADNLVIAPRHGTWFDHLVRIPGAEIPQERAGPIAAAHVMAARRDRAVVHADVIGWGLSCVNFLTENRVQVVPVNFANKTIEHSADGNFRFANMRAQVIWRMREALDPSNAAPIALPPDPKIKADLASYRWSLTKSGIQIEAKEKQKERLGHSPDDGDSICLANMQTIKIEQYEVLVSQAKARDRYAELDEGDRYREV